jgi:protein Tex
LRERIRLRDYVTDEVGLPTLEDIMNEMNKPGRDPRKSFEVFEFSKGIMDISDLRQGMVLPGIVTNITKFGAFVDVGVHQDGLVHVSQLADRFVSDPAEVVKISQQVTVRVVEVDVARKRISLSMKKEEKPTGKPGSKPDKKPDKHSAGGDMKSKLEALRGKFK